MAFLVAGLSFADAGISVGGWGRAGLTFQNDGSSGAKTNWVLTPGWANGGRVGVNFNGHSDNIGFSLNVDNNGGNIGIGDQAKIFAKFNDMVTVQIGKIQGDTLRGKFGDLYGNSDVMGFGEDGIFQRFLDTTGALVELTPVTGLYVGAALKGSATAVVADDLSKNTQVGAGYTIADVGLIRAQMLGAKDPSYQVAFQLKAVKDLGLDAGVTVPTASGAKVTAAAGASFSGVEKLGLQARFTYAEKNIGIGGEAAYAVDGPLTVGAGAAITALTSDQATISVAPFAKLGYSNGYATARLKIDAAKNVAWSIPVNLEYWF